jgi:hypothetical protein
MRPSSAPATTSAVFSLPFVNLGICPEAASSLLMPHPLLAAEAGETEFADLRAACDAIGILLKSAVDKGRIEPGAPASSLFGFMTGGGFMQITRQPLHRAVSP